MERPATLVGLSEVEAASRLRVEGPNELRRPTRRRFTQIVFEILSEPMIQLLLGASAIYFALGDIGEALMLAGSAVITVVVAIVQESRTERVLEALRDLSSPRALVIRDGTSRRIPGREDSSNIPVAVSVNGIRTDERARPASPGIPDRVALNQLRVGDRKAPRSVILLQERTLSRKASITVLNCSGLCSGAKWLIPDRKINSAPGIL